ncbi:MAG: DUF1501 domain-containing protein [Planctomycetaceae bacterium]
MPRLPPAPFSSLPEPVRNPLGHAVHHQSAARSSSFAPSLRDLIRVGSRRWFLQLGLGGAAGLSLPGLLRANAEGATKQAPRSVILIWLSGGPSHIDMWDMKPEAPVEIRGPFRSIKTAVPGIEISEHLPKQAAMMEKFSIIRSMDATASNHTPVTFQAANPNARRTNDGKDGGGYPSMGSVAAKFRGANRPGMPPFVALADSMIADVYGAGQLGSAYDPLEGMKVTGKFGMPKGVNVSRLQDRDRLRKEFDQLRREVDASRDLTLQDRYVQEALSMVLGGQTERAFDLNQEPAAVRDRYGRHSMGEKTLLARRLVEAGVTFVTLSDAWGHWDHHGDDVRWMGIEKGLKPMLPELDHGITNLVSDLEDRGLLDSTLVLILGEFGRTPKINEKAGRHHWEQVMSLLVAGGGMRHGQVIGATDRTGSSIKERPLGPGDLAATVFHHLGIDPHGYWTNPRGRPTPLVEGNAAPIRELA